MQEDIIKALECCAKKVCIYKDTLKECPYHELCDEFFEDCTTALAKDAIALVKAQEPNPMPGAGLTDAELMEKVRKAPITLKPAANAIPVGWIKNRLEAMLRGPASAESCFAVLLLLADWQREQEGRASDGKDA